MCGNDILDNTALLRAESTYLLVMLEQILCWTFFMFSSWKCKYSPWPLSPHKFVRSAWIILVGQWARMVIHKAKRHIVGTTMHFFRGPFPINVVFLLLFVPYEYGNKL